MNRQRRLLLAVALALAGPAARTGARELAITPPPGSTERAALLDAVRAALRLDPRASRFKVFHLRRTGNWAYFEGNEVVPLDDGEWQETDLTVKALLRLANGAWRADLIWTLPGDETSPLARFQARLATARRREAIPDGIFP